MYEEYASEGSAPAPAAAKRAALLPTIIRASRYVGETQGELALGPEEPGRPPPPARDDVERRQPDIDPREWDRGQQPVRERREAKLRARRCQGAHSAAMPSGTACVTSISLRTKLHGTAARRHASSTRSSCSRGASGIVTSTASGARRPIAQPMSPRPPAIETPWIRRPPSAWSSSTSPMTRSPGV